MFHSATCFRLVVAGRLSVLLADTIDDRFGASAVIRRTHDEETVVVLTADQASLRALLTLLWDWGHDLVTVSECQPDPDRDDPEDSLRVSTLPGPAILGPEPRPDGALTDASQEEKR